MKVHSLAQAAADPEQVKAAIDGFLAKVEQSVKNEAFRKRLNDEARLFRVAFARDHPSKQKPDPAGRRYGSDI